MAQRQTNIGEPEVKRLPLMGAYSNRGSSASKDQRFVNMFPETRKVDQLDNTKITINKRPGLVLYKNFGTGEGREIAYFNGKFYVGVGNTVYEDGTTPVAKITLTNSSGQLSMINANSSTLGDYLWVCDGTSGWFIKTDGSVTQVSANSLHSVTLSAAGSGYTNGTYSLGFSGGGGSGAAGTYTVSGNVVTTISMTSLGTGYTSAPTVSFPSGGGTGASAIAKVNAFPTPHVPVASFLDGYITLAKGSDLYTCDLDDPSKWSSESFLSAEMFPDPIKSQARQNNQLVIFGSNSIEFFYDAANASGSPLSRNDSTVIQMGIAAPYCIYQNEQSCAYVSQSDSGGRAVWMIKGFQPTRVSDEFIERILDSAGDLSNSHGFGVRSNGHLLYLINLPNIGRTLLYDTDEKLWHEWSSNSSGNHAVFACSHIADNGLGAAYLLHNSNGNVYKLDPSIATDDGTPILCEIVTNKYDMDSYHRKFMHSLKVIGDRYSNNSINVQWTDDDYQTWSNVKTIDLADDFPAFHRLGSFRRRAFKLTHSLNQPLRLESIEVEYHKGST